MATASGFAAQVGLTSVEAAARLATEGANELPQPDRRTLVRIVFEVVREPMLALAARAAAPSISSSATRRRP